MHIGQEMLSVARPTLDTDCYKAVNQYVAQALHRLTSKHEPYDWKHQEQQESFEKLKHLITTAPVLLYLEVQKDVVIQGDSSSVGLCTDREGSTCHSVCLPSI